MFGGPEMDVRLRTSIHARRIYCWRAAEQKEFYVAEDHMTSDIKDFPTAGTHSGRFQALHLRV